MAGTVSRANMNSYSSSVSGGTTPSGLYLPADVPDWTKVVQRTDTPFLKMIGRNSAPKVPNIKRQWGWSYPDAYTDQVDGAINNSATSLVVDNGAKFQIGDVILVGSEELRVTAISSNTLTVTRGFAGTTAASIADNAPIYILGPAIPENTDDPASPHIDGEIDYNHPQIFTFTWQYSQRARLTPTYESQHFSGTRDEQELRKKMEETAPLRLELTLLLGQRAQGTASSPSAMGGLRQSSFITTRTDLAGSPFTEYDLMNNLQTVYNLVGPSTMGKTIMCSPFTARVISSWYNDSRRTSASDEKINVRFSEIDTWFGVVKVVPHYLMSTIANDRVYIFNEDDFALEPYASSTGWQTGKLATQGWYDKGYLRGDYTLVAGPPDTKLEIYGFSTNANDYTGLS